MSAPSTRRVLPAHEQRIVDYYDEDTLGIYLKAWDPDHIHFGLFGPDDPAEPDKLRASPAFARALRRMVECIAAGAAIEPQHLVVDAGCGVGGAARLVARRWGAQVVGVNICDHQLELARARTQAEGLQDRVRFMWADCSRQLPFADGSVDVVLNIESACHYSDRHQFLAECARILRPGGKIAGSDWVASDHLGSQQYRAHIQPVCDAWLLAPLETPTSYRRRVSEAGLVLTQDETFGSEVLPNSAVLRMKAAKLTQQAARGDLGPARTRWLRQFSSLSRAWDRGFFELWRYIAVAA